MSLDGCMLRAFRIIWREHFWSVILSFFYNNLLSLVTYMYVTKKIVPAYTGDYIENTCVCSMLDKVYLSLSNL